MNASDYMWQAHMQVIWKEAHRAIVGASSNLTITTRTPVDEQNTSYVTRPNPRIGSFVEIDDCTGRGITQRLQTYQSTAVTSPVWPSRTTGASEGWSTWTRESATSAAVGNAKLTTNAWLSNWAHKILDKVAAHYCISFWRTGPEPRIWRLLTSQMYTLLSVDPLIMYAPSGLNAACNTRNTGLCQCMCVCNYHHKRSDRLHQTW